MKVIQTGDQVTKISFSPPENSIIFSRGNKIFWFGKKNPGRQVLAVTKSSLNFSVCINVCNACVNARIHICMS